MAVPPKKREGWLLAQRSPDTTGDAMIDATHNAAYTYVTSPKSQSLVTLKNHADVSIGGEAVDMLRHAIDDFASALLLDSLGYSSPKNIETAKTRLSLAFSDLNSGFRKKDLEPIFPEGAQKVEYVRGLENAIRQSIPGKSKGLT